MTRTAEPAVGAARAAASRVQDHDTVRVGTRIEHDAATRRVPTARLLVAGTMLAGLLGILIARWWTGAGYVPAPLGLPDPGLVTAVGLPVAQFVHEIAGTAVVGLLFLRAVALTGPQGPGGRHLLAMTARWAWLWVGSTVAWIALSASDLTGMPVGELLGRTDLLPDVAGTDRILAQLATLWVALAVALFATRLTSGVSAGAVLIIAVAALLPSALTGHAGHHQSPTVAVIALGVHLAAAAIWVGGLLALVVHLRRFPDELRRAVPRFSAAALLCVIAVGLSGIVESVVTLQVWNALWTTDRGHLIIAKTLALAVLAVFGYVHRRRTIGPAGTGRLTGLLSLAAGELLVMGATIGVAVVLSTTA